MKQSAFFIFVILLASITMTLWYFWQNMQTELNTPLNLESEIIFTIEPGMSLNQVADDLKQHKLISQSHYLLLEAKLQGIEGKIKAGKYSISPGTTPLQLLNQFVSGEVVNYTITIVEGWNFRQMLEAIANHPDLEHTLKDMDSADIMGVLQIQTDFLEGQFFPDTYKFPAGTSDVDILQRSHVRLNKILQEEWEQRSENLPYQSPQEALIMASIIEKETGLASERSEIAGVFVRRLQKNMLLQTDPTVIYAMGENFNGNIQRKDLKIDSPYNTYVTPGLPPTPIALVGREAIHAALHPAEGKTLYFVARGDGSHHFSETLEEHNRAVAKYQLGQGAIKN